jgi:NTE family protein
MCSNFSIEGKFSSSSCCYALVISGGGSRGILALGILKKIQQVYPKYLDNIKIFSGTSIGSLITLLLCLNFSVDEIYTMIIDQIIPLMLSSLISSLSLKNIKEKFGLLDIHSIFSVIENAIYKKYETIPTLKEIHTIFDRIFMCCSYNLTKHKLVYLDYLSYPNLQCTEAIKMSCLIPMLFQKYTYSDCLYIDGGIQDNFPVEYIEKKYIEKKIVCNTHHIDIANEEEKDSVVLLTHQEDQKIILGINLHCEFTDYNYDSYSITNYLTDIIFSSGRNHKKKKLMKKRNNVIIDCKTPHLFSTIEIRDKELKRYLFEGYEIEV